MTQSAQRLDQLVGGLLDKGYTRATQATLRAVAASVQSGLVAQRLAELDQAVAQLGRHPLRPDHPVLRALLADLDTELRRVGVRLDAGASAAQQAGVATAGQVAQELAFPGVPSRALNLVGVRWNVPDPDAVNALVGYVNSPGWAEELARYPGMVLETVRHQAILGMVEGWGATKTAREIRRMVQGVPVAQANTLMRTVQLQSFRDAHAIHQQANADILTEQIRIAALDDRTCLCCIALHGTHLPVGERITDHHAGRCTSIAVVRGRPREVQTGEAWFNRLDEARQRAIAGNAAFEALKSGQVQLKDFVQPYQDRVFGEMVREASVKGLLGGATTRQPAPVLPRPPVPHLPRWNEAEPVRRVIEPPGTLEREGRAWAKGLSGAERRGVEVYTGGGYTTINQVVRGKSLPDATEQQYRGFIDGLNRALTTAPTFRGVTWRGITLNEGDLEPLLERYRRQVGTVFTWDAYASTSFNPRVAEEFAGKRGLIFEVRSTRGRWVEHASSHKVEREVVFPPGTELRVIEVREIQLYNDRMDRNDTRWMVVVDDVTE